MRNIVARRLRKMLAKSLSPDTLLVLLKETKLRLVNPDAVKLDSLFGLNCQGTVKWTGFIRLYKDIKKEYKNT